MTSCDLTLPLLFLSHYKIPFCLSFVLFCESRDAPELQDNTIPQPDSFCPQNSQLQNETAAQRFHDGSHWDLAQASNVLSQWCLVHFTKTVSPFPQPCKADTTKNCFSCFHLFFLFLTQTERWMYTKLWILDQLMGNDAFVHCESSMARSGKRQQQKSSWQSITK